MKQTQLEALIAPVLAQFSMELDGLDIVSAGKRSIVRVTVDGDGPQGRGLLLDDIAEATRAISDALDESRADGSQPYTLEVSSRGVSKPLVEPKHWRRNTGRLVAVTQSGGTKTTGRILSSDDAGAHLELTDDKGRTSETDVAFADVTKAVVQVELNRKPDPDLDDVAEDSATDDEE